MQLFRVELRNLSKALNPPEWAAERKIVRRLEIEPELRRGAKGLRKEPRGLGRDTAPATNELVDPLKWNAEVFGKGHLRETQRDEELLSQDLAGMGGGAV